MIFVTVGTHTQPFGRALDLLAALEREEPIVIQHGVTPARPEWPASEWHPFLDADAMAERMTEARVVVSHAGVGCMLMSLRAGKKPILIPRRFALAEHVDDHQRQLADRFGRRGLAFVCADGAPLGPLVARAGAEPPYEFGDVADALGHAVVTAALGATPRRRWARLRRS